MPDYYLFSDEAGDMEFTRKQNVSRYFIICTVTAGDLSAGRALEDLRRRLIRENVEVHECFHATYDSQDVRDRVFSELLQHKFKVQATICEKAKAQPHIRSSKDRFFKYPWFYHLKHGISRHVPNGSHLYVTAAAIGTKKEKATYINNLRDVAQQNLSKSTFSVDFRPAQADPWLQVADYCAWAIQRKWERGDSRSYDLISHRISYEYELWSQGTQVYY